MKASSPIPQVPGAWPLLGHAVPILRDPLAFVTSLPEHGDVVRVRIGPAEVVVVCDVDLTWHVLSHDRAFDKGGLTYERARTVFGDGLASCAHKRHRRQRRLLQPAFRADRLAEYTEVMVEQIHAATTSWRHGQDLDVFAEMTAMTSKTTLATLFGDSMDPVTLRQTLDDLSVVLSGIAEQMVVPPPLNRAPTPGHRRYHRAGTRLRQTLGRIIADRRSAGDDAGSGHLLASLLSARDDGEDGDGLSDAEILDEVVSFFFAGADTTASTLAWALHALSLHPDVLAGVQAEADQVLAGRPAVLADLPRLELTNRVITETLRLWPAGWMFTRSMAEDAELGDHHISAGTTVVYSPYMLHHNPALFERPEHFDPDRWLPDRARQVRRQAYIPFGAGARKCIGENFSLIETTLALATIVNRWRLEPVPGHRARPSVAAVLRPKGLRMRAVARTPGRPHDRGVAAERSCPWPHQQQGAEMSDNRPAARAALDGTAG